MSIYISTSLLIKSYTNWFFLTLSYTIGFHTKYTCMYSYVLGAAAEGGDAHAMPFEFRALEVFLDSGKKSHYRDCIAQLSDFNMHIHGFYVR